MQNCIVKIINGRPVVFGEAGKDEKDALVYIFEEEEAFNAALDEGLIPVGTLIVKTYDEVEMAGGPFDDALSDVSENAVQNKVVKAKTDELSTELSKIGTIVNGSKYSDVEFPGGDISKPIGSIELDPGGWIVLVTGWPPLPSGSLITLDSNVAQCQEHSISSTSLVNINKKTTFELIGRCFNPNPVTVSPVYNFVAIRIK